MRDDVLLVVFLALAGQQIDAAADLLLAVVLGWSALCAVVLAGFAVRWWRHG